MLSVWIDLPKAALVAIKQLTKNTGAIEVRIAEPIHTPIWPYERCRGHVSYHAVVVNRQISASKHNVHVCAHPSK